MHVDYTKIGMYLGIVFRYKIKPLYLVGWQSYYERSYFISEVGAWCLHDVSSGVLHNSRYTPESWITWLTPNYYYGWTWKPVLHCFGLHTKQRRILRDVSTQYCGSYTVNIIRLKRIQCYVSYLKYKCKYYLRTFVT